MDKDHKDPSFMQVMKHYWKEVPPVRWLMTFCLTGILLVTTIQACNAAFVYKDWRCFWADCKILKAGDKELLQIED